MSIAVVVVVVILIFGAVGVYFLWPRRRDGLQLGVTKEPEVGMHASGTVVSSQTEDDKKVVEHRRGIDGSLPKSRSLLGAALARMRSRRALGEELWIELEEALILSDVGVEVSVELVEAVKDKVFREGITSTDAALGLLRAEMIKKLERQDRHLNIDVAPPAVILFVGVNGVGKTTSIGKLAALLSSQGKKVVVAAGDTFRAAAAEQLEMWAKRSGVEVVKGSSGADPASVVFDAISHATAVGADCVLADTAGRLQNRQNLMDELRKIRRVAEKASGTVSEVLLVLDATTGQNGLVQAQGFGEAAQVTGIVLTKLDGTAKGGVAFVVEEKLKIPIKFVGIGEGVEDMTFFDPVAFVNEITGDVS